MRRLTKGDIDLRVGNGAKVAVVSVGTYALSLASGYELYLNNCYFIPILSKNIIFISVLDSEGISFTIKDKCCTFRLMK